jgi:toxin CptA
MSSNSFDATVDLAPQPSLRAFRWIFVLHVLPLALLPFAMEPGTPMLLLVAVFAASWVWLRRHPALGFGSRGLSRLTWHADGSWSVEEASGRRADAELLGNSLVHPWLIVLNFKLAQGGRRTRILLGDELNAESLRRLRVRLGASRPV